MKTIEIIGYRRANLGKAGSQKLRDEGLVPCVLYGGDRTGSFLCADDPFPRSWCTPTKLTLFT